jgi:hypothetical protein
MAVETMMRHACALWCMVAPVCLTVAFASVFVDGVPSMPSCGVEGGRERHGLQAQISTHNGTYWNTPTGYGADKLKSSATAAATGRNACTDYEIAYGSGQSVFTQASTCLTA